MIIQTLINFERVFSNFYCCLFVFYDLPFFWFSCHSIFISMSQFIDIIEIGKEKSISNKKAAEMLTSFINANSANENDTFDETKIVRLFVFLFIHSWMMLL